MVSRTKARVLSFGEHASADVRALDVRLDEEGRARFTLVADGVEAPVGINLVGEHHVANALAAAAACTAVGMTVPQIAAGLGQAVALSGGRMAVNRRADGVIVIDDAYNANPESMRAGLKALVTLARNNPESRSWAVLGQMAELGERSAEEHDAIGRLAVRLRVDRLLAVGPEARMIHAGAGHEGSGGQESATAADVDEAIAVLRAELRPGDIVLVKASNSVGLQRVAKALLEEAR
jgi:UDP-N-acetylmuramoyl-tripeptide--D-alanyl-D-alanine ligase